MTFRPLHTEDDRARALGHAGPAVIFKHSPACGSSFRAFAEVKAFSRAWPEVPVFVVDVIAERPLSTDLATTLGVSHQSPQVIVLSDGVPAWSESHSRITAQRLAAAVIIATTTAAGGDAAGRDAAGRDAAPPTVAPDA